MPRVTFSADFDWKPRPQITIGYLAGSTVLVTQACAKAAEARGVGKLTNPPKALK